MWELKRTVLQYNQEQKECATRAKKMHEAKVRTILKEIKVKANIAKQDQLGGQTEREITPSRKVVGRKDQQK